MSLGLLYVAIQQGLLFRPDMQVAGGEHRHAPPLVRRPRHRRHPGRGVLSLPLWLYRVAMLLWAFWLAASLVRGVGPAWRAFTQGGLWRPFPRPTRPSKPPAPLRAAEAGRGAEGLSAPGTADTDEGADLLARRCALLAGARRESRGVSETRRRA